MRRPYSAARLLLVSLLVLACCKAAVAPPAAYKAIQRPRAATRRAKAVHGMNGDDNAFLSASCRTSAGAVVSFAVDDFIFDSNRSFPVAVGASVTDDIVVRALIPGDVVVSRHGVFAETASLLSAIDNTSLLRDPRAAVVTVEIRLVRRPRATHLSVADARASTRRKHNDRICTATANAGQRSNSAVTARRLNSKICLQHLQSHLTASGRMAAATAGHSAEVIAGNSILEFAYRAVCLATLRDGGSASARRSGFNQDVFSSAIMLAHQLIDNAASTPQQKGLRLVTGSVILQQHIMSSLRDPARFVECLRASDEHCAVDFRTDFPVQYVWIAMHAFTSAWNSAAGHLAGNSIVLQHRYASSDALPLVDVATMPRFIKAMLLAAQLHPQFKQFRASAQAQDVLSVTSMLELLLQIASEVGAVRSTLL